MIDQPTTVRTGEELDLLRLEHYLVQHLVNARGPLVVEQFPSGYSNLTYLLRMGEQELVLRRPPFGATIKSAHDMGREYTVLAGLRYFGINTAQPSQHRILPPHIMRRFDGGPKGRAAQD